MKIQGITDIITIHLVVEYKHLHRQIKLEICRIVVRICHSEPLLVVLWKSTKTSRFIIWGSWISVSVISFGFDFWLTVSWENDNMGKDGWQKATNWTLQLWHEPQLLGYWGAQPVLDFLAIHSIFVGILHVYFSVIHVLNTHIINILPWTKNVFWYYCILLLSFHPIFIYVTPHFMWHINLYHRTISSAALSIPPASSQSINRRMRLSIPKVTFYLLTSCFHFSELQVGLVIASTCSQPARMGVFLSFRWLQRLRNKWTNLNIFQWIHLHLHEILILFLNSSVTFQTYPVFTYLVFA